MRGSIWIAVAAVGLVASPASAQLFIMGRTSDRSDIVVSVNEPDGEARVRERAAQLGGQWQMIHRSTACGWAAVYVVSNLREGGGFVRYFVQDGAVRSGDANRRAREQALAFNNGRRGYYVGSVRSDYLNRNRYVQNPTTLQWIMERTVGMDRCDRLIREGASVGRRG